MATKIVDIHDTEITIAEWLRLVQEGDELVITDDDHPLARLMPVDAPPHRRVAGLNRGQIWTSEDFDEPLPDEFWMGAA